MNRISIRRFGQATLLMFGVTFWAGRTITAQDVSFDLQSKLTDVTARISPLGHEPNASTGELRSNMMPSIGDPFAAAQAKIQQGPRFTDATGSTCKWYPVSTSKIHFSMTETSGDFTASAIARTAATLSANEKRSNTNSHVWDDKWYWRTLPTGGSKYLLLFWHDWTSGRLEWAAIKNTPQKWLVISSNGVNTSPGNGKQIKIRHVITKENRIVDIDIYNPDNSGDWTSNDIWYGFGY